MQKLDVVQDAPQLANDRQQRAGCGRYDSCCCRRYIVLAVFFVRTSCSPESLARLANVGDRLHSLLFIGKCPRQLML